MIYNPLIHHRKSIRLKGFDYSQAGLYFITFCCQNRRHLFGKINDGKMYLNDAGKFAEKCWMEIPNHFDNVILHEFVIMPNHVHGIIEFVAVGANQLSPKNNNMKNIVSNHAKNVSQNGPKNDTINRAKNVSPLFVSPSKTIGSVIRGFKIGVTKWMRQNTDIIDVWQRNYYEHIIRDDNAYHRISEYIINNPSKWKEDTFCDK